jgi:hypothetical protein
MKYCQNQNGVMLILAMLIMSIVVAASLAASLLVMSEIRQSNQIDDAMIAYYAAESGAERGLYLTRKRDYDPQSFNTKLLDLENNSRYEMVATNTEKVIYTSIKTNESQQFDIYVPGALSSSTVDQIKSINIKILPVNYCRLEVNWVCWDENGNFGKIESAYRSSYPDAAGFTYALYNLIPGIGTYCKSFRVRVIPRSNSTCTDTTISPVEVRAYTNTDGTGLVNIPSRVQIKSIGSFPKTSTEAVRQAILISMPRRSPTSRLFDYVLFSEQDIEKK